MIQADFSNAHTDLSDPALAERVAKIHERLHHHPDLMCGWVEYPFQVSDAELDKIIQAAEPLQRIYRDWDRRFLPWHHCRHQSAASAI